MNLKNLVKRAQNKNKTKQLKDNYYVLKKAKMFFQRTLDMSLETNHTLYFYCYI